MTAPVLHAPASSGMVRLLPFLALMFSCTFAGSMTVPFMGFFLVQELGQSPWVLSLYGVMSAGFVVTLNRHFGRMVDQGRPVAPLIALAIGGYCLGCLSLLLVPHVAVVLTLGVLGFGLSASGISNMFALGGGMGERAGVERSRMNAFMRATTSAAWMIGPALAYLLNDHLGAAWVFGLGGLVMGGLSTVLWATVLPKGVCVPAKPDAAGDLPRLDWDAALVLGVGFIFTLSLAHGLTFGALALFYVKDAGLPEFAPGLGFTVKTFVEILVIFAAPHWAGRFGLKRVLLANTGLAVVAILALASVQSLPQMLGAAALEGAYYGIYASLGISYVQALRPKIPAQATALYWNALMVTGLVSAPIVGLVAEMRDFATVIYLAAGVAAIALAVLFAGPSPDKG